MPVLHAVRHHVGGAGGDGAERAVVDQLARQLVRAAEEGVGRGADAQVAVGQRLELQALLDAEHEGLLGVDVLAGLERLRG